MPLSKKTFFCFTCLIFLVFDLRGQSSGLKGKVIDYHSNRPIFGAVVCLTTDPHIKFDGEFDDRSITDIEGVFELSISSGRPRYILVRHLGYKTYFKEMKAIEGQTLLIALQPDPMQMKEVIIFSLKNTTTDRNSTVPVEVMEKNQFDVSLPQDMPSAISTLPGIALAGDGVWASSINIRGLGAQRYVTLIDGNRIETAHDLSGVLATVNLNDIERIEVVKGATSSLYGSGAMGGIVNVISKTAEYSNNFYLNGTSGFEFRSVNNLTAPGLSIFSGGRRWKVKLNLGYRNAGEAKSPEGPVDNSQFNDWNISGNVGVKLLRNHELTLDYQEFRASSGIPGGSVFPSPARATYLDADRQLLALQYKIKPSSRLSELVVKYYRQSLFRNVEVMPNVPPRSDNNNRVSVEQLRPSATHVTEGILLQGKWKCSSRGEMIAGLDVWQRKLESQRERHLLQEKLDSAGHVLSSTSVTRGEIPIPSSVFKSAGPFFQFDFDLNRDWKLNAGGRLDWIRLSNEESYDPSYIIRGENRLDRPPGQIIVYPKASNSDFTWALNGGIRYRISEDIHSTFSVGRSYRAPSLEERYKYINLGNAIEYGNPELLPEQGNFFDIGIKLHRPKLEASGHVFLNDLNNLITMVPADSISFLLRGIDGGFTDHVRILRYKNIVKALLTGFELRAVWMFHPDWKLNGNLSYVHGKNLTEGTNLPMIAPLNGIIEIRHKVKDILSWDFRIRMFDEQVKVAEGELPTNGYVIYDCFVHSLPISLKPVQVQFHGGVENIMNTAYRNHLATNRGRWTLEPGRNFIAKVTVRW